MVIYISGPMTGIKYFNSEAFYAAERMWKAAGHTPINPAASFGGDKSLARRLYMLEDVKSVLISDALSLLPGWEKSKGAALEIAIAAELGLKFFDNATMQEIPTPRVELSVSPGGESPAQYAHRIVRGARRAAYGHPLDDYTRTGRMWGAILGIPDIPAEVCTLMMAVMKVSRQINSEKFDNIADAIGYFECTDLAIEERDRRKVESNVAQLALPSR